MANTDDISGVLHAKDEMIRQLKRDNEIKAAKIAELVGLIDKYKSVVSANQNSGLTEVKKRGRGVGISAEPQEWKSPDFQQRKQKHYPKAPETRDIIERAIMNNDFMKHYELAQIREIVECMYPVQYKANSVIIQEGSEGSMVYALEEGIVQISKKGTSIREMNDGQVFGELAILYKCARTATVTAKTNCKIWAIDRQCFQSIMVKTGLERQQNYLDFLKSVPAFKDLRETTLLRVVDVLEEVQYLHGECIIRQGAKGDTFFIISKGKVKVTTTKADANEEIFIREMVRGEWFGEKALKDEDVRTASIFANDPEGVSCLILDRTSYLKLIADNSAFERRYSDERIHIPKKEDQFTQLTLRDLVVVATLGVGGFGRVELVRIGTDNTKSYALKQLKKSHIVETRQQEHVLNERNILKEVNTDFIVKIHRTFKDKKYLYIMMEACLGGELWTILRNKGAFDDMTTHYYTACVVEGLGYLHNLGIIYRDLKPENLLIDQHGWCKMTDFGFAKHIGHRKTWTFCGTPEYVAPEIILNKGHDLSADFWSLGILMFELLTGTPPFTAPDPMKTYNIILKGIDAIDFPRKITKNAQSLIKKLCRDNPGDRLGYGKRGIWAVQKHVWFESFNWDGLRNRSMKPPIMPTVRSPIDSANFDKYPEDSSVPPDDVTGWDRDF